MLVEKERIGWFGREKPRDLVAGDRLDDFRIGAGREHHDAFPRERRKLYDLIRQTRAENLLILSGDRHLGALYRETTGTPYPITRNLIEEGRNHLLLGSKIDLGCPVRILQGAQDPDVPWKHAFALAHRLPAEDVVLTMIQDGDHRLSRPQDIARIIAAVAEIG